MPVGIFERDVLRVMAANRNPDSFVGCATILHLGADTPRASRDVDVFHESAESLARSASSHMKTLLATGCVAMALFSNAAAQTADPRQVPPSDAATIAPHSQVVHRTSPASQRPVALPPQLKTRTYKLHPATMQRILGLEAITGAGAGDSGAGTGSGNGYDILLPGVQVAGGGAGVGAGMNRPGGISRVTRQRTTESGQEVVRSFFASAGIDLGPGSTILASVPNGILQVRAPQEQLDKVQRVLATLEAERIVPKPKGQGEPAEPAPAAVRIEPPARTPGTR